MLDLCPHCNETQLMVNGMNPNSGIVSYVCWNPRCSMYKQAFTATGEATTTLITDQPPDRAAETPTGTTTA